MHGDVAGFVDGDEAADIVFEHLLGEMFQRIIERESLVHHERMHVKRDAVANEVLAGAGATHGARLVVRVGASADDGRVANASPFLIGQSAS